MEHEFLVKFECPNESLLFVVLETHLDSTGEQCADCGSADVLAHRVVPVRFWQHPGDQPYSVELVIQVVIPSLNLLPIYLFKLIFFLFHRQWP